MLTFLRLASALFNTLILCWLGLTVLLNTSERKRGAYLAVAGLLTGSAFFGAHILTLDFDASEMVQGAVVPWFGLGLPIIGLPLGWYVLMLWYSGFGFRHRARESHALRRRHAIVLTGCATLGAALVGLLVITFPRLNLARLPAPYHINGLTFTGVRVLMWAYPLYLLACTLGALDALRRPASTQRALGDEARRRARPYLIASTWVQLGVGGLVGAVVLGLAAMSLSRPLYPLFDALDRSLLWLEVVASLGVGASVALFGKAVVSYELFTGRPLPRRGFLRQWRSVVLGALAYSIPMAYAGTRAWSVAHSAMPPLVLLPTWLLAGVAAGLSWRANAERDELLSALQTLVASQGIYERLTDAPRESGHADAQGDAGRPERVFASLCREVLNARCGFVCALGPLAPFAGTPLVFPDYYEAPDVAPLLPRFASGATLLHIEPDAFNGAAFAIPLRGADTLVGALLLGEKRDGSLYALEEIEVARLSAERLLDARAGSELARRLLELGRRRVGETALLDRHARRALHDDVLPRLHAALLALSGRPDEATREAVQSLSEAHRDISALLREGAAREAPVARLGLDGALQSCADECAHDFDHVRCCFDPEAVAEARRLPPLVSETLFYAAREAMRNASRHARAARPLSLCVSLQARDGLRVLVEDDGAGPNIGKTAANDKGGSGQGLALHGAMLAVVGGSLSVSARPEGGTCAIIALPAPVLRGWTSEEAPNKETP